MGPEKKAPLPASEEGRGSLLRREGAGLLADEGDLDAPVLLASGRAPVIGDRLGLAVTDRFDPRARDAHPGQSCPNGCGPALRQRLIIGVGALRIGMAVDMDADL